MRPDKNGGKTLQNGTEVLIQHASPKSKLISERERHATWYDLTNTDHLNRKGTQNKANKLLDVRAHYFGGSTREFICADL